MAEVETKTITELEADSDVNNTDNIIVGYNGGDDLRRVTWSNVLQNIKEALQSWTFSALNTSSKLITGAINELYSGKAPTSHASSGTSYGVGTSSNYGHCRTINNLTTSSHTNGYALSAYQGYLLNQNKISSSDFSIVTFEIAGVSCESGGDQEVTLDATVDGYKLLDAWIRDVTEARLLCCGIRVHTSNSSVVLKFHVYSVLSDVTRDTVNVQCLYVKE